MWNVECRMKNLLPPFSLLSTPFRIPFNAIPATFPYRCRRRYRKRNGGSKFFILHSTFFILHSTFFILHFKVLNFLMYLIIIPSVTNAAMASDVGIAHHTPSTPKPNGSKNSRGSRNSICLDSERNMLTFALPMLWKKFVVTI